MASASLYPLVTTTRANTPRCRPNPLTLLTAPIPPLMPPNQGVAGRGPHGTVRGALATREAQTKLADQKDLAAKQAALKKVSSAITDNKMGHAEQKRFDDAVKKYSTCRIDNQQALGAGGAGTVCRIVGPQGEETNKVFKIWNTSLSTKQHTHDAFHEICALRVLAGRPGFQKPPEICVMKGQDGRYHTGVVMDRLEGHDLFDDEEELFQALSQALGNAYGAQQPAQRAWPMENVTHELLRDTRGLVGLLHQLSQAGLVHGDIKQENLFVAPNGELTMIDWSSCRQAQQKTPFTGTSGYIPPESWLEKSTEQMTHTPAQDVYSTGVVIAGRLVTVVQALRNTLAQEIGQPPQPLTGYSPLRRDYQNPSHVPTQEIAQYTRQHYEEHFNNPNITNEDDLDRKLRMGNVPGSSPPLERMNAVQERRMLRSGLCSAAQLQLFDDLEAVAKRMMCPDPRFRYTAAESELALQIAENRYRNHAVQARRPDVRFGPADEVQLIPATGRNLPTPR